MRKITLFLTMLLLVCVSTAVAQENGKMYKLKIAGTSKYLTAFDNTENRTGAVGGVGVTTSTANENAQIFTFTSATDVQGNSGFTLKSNEGRFIKCWKWNVDAIDGSQSSVLIFESVGNGQFKIKWYNNESDGYGAHNAIKYIKSEIPRGLTTEYVFGDASSTQAATWELEEFTTNTSTVITSVSQLNNEKVYTIKSKDYALRGFMYSPESGNVLDFAGGTYSDRNGTPTYNNVSYNPEDKKQQFTIVKHNDKYYLYSLAKGKFAADNGDLNVLRDEATDNNIEITYDASTSSFSMKFVSTNNYITAAPGWHTLGACFITKNTSIGDDGDRFIITEVGDMTDEDKAVVQQKLLGFAPAEFDAKFELFCDYLNISSRFVDGEVVGTVGYPVATSGVVEEMNTVYTRIMSAGYGTDRYTYNSTDYQDVVSLISSYESSTDVKMPEDGKAYVFTNINPEDGNVYLYSDADNALQLAARGETLANDLPISAKFICKKVNDKYVFVNNNGKYLVWRGNDVCNGGVNGFSDTYKEDYCPLTFTKMALNGNSTSAASSISDLVGMLAFGGKRSDNAATANSYFVITNATEFNKDSGFQLRYANDYSTAFIVEEVPYPNTPKLNAVEGSTLMSEDLQSSTMGTFSAPFATVVPAGVTAYYVAADGKNNDYAQITTAATAGQAIPKNQGVILVGSEAGNVVMLPATAESPVEISNNQLGNTAGAAKTLAVAGEGHYILTGGAQGAGFYSWTKGILAMNKAYLDGTNVSAANAMKLVWNAETTGIETLVPATDVNAPIYDLSGRRVLNTVKGGVYIQNGKKFIVK